MKKLWILFTALILFIAAGCSHNVDEVVIIDDPPEAPRNVYSITGDSEVLIGWDHNTEADLDGYAVYIGTEPEGRYELIGTTLKNYYIADVANGVTRYFAVVAYDYNGNESELSYETVWDTPRPEGYNAIVYARYYDEDETNADICGLDLSDWNGGMIQDYFNESNDIFFDIVDGVVYINVYNTEDTDIAVFGPTNDLTDVDFVYEDTDWDSEGYFEAIEDYAYIVWTWDNHFAVVRIEEVMGDKVIFSWAYQTDTGNPQLKVAKLNSANKRTIKAPVKNTGAVNLEQLNIQPNREGR